MGAIQPPFTAYQISVQATTRNSPPLPAVAITQTDLTDGRSIQSHVITPEQAIVLAQDLMAAAREALKS